MNITAWRITRQTYIDEAFSGAGAKLFGGRWNPVGYAAVYTAENLSLAILELLVHLEDSSDINSFVAIPVTFGQSMVYAISADRLPASWQNLPVSSASQELGKRWLEEGRTPVLQVPSAIVPSESNFVINPRHTKFPKLAIGPAQPLQIDQRIVGLSQ